jgi:hypothetical protein
MSLPGEALCAPPAVFRSRYCGGILRWMRIMTPFPMASSDELGREE